MDKSPILVNLGCGPIQPKGWVNVDYSNRARLAKHLPILDRLFTRLGLIPPTEFSTHTTIIDLRRKLPFAESSVQGFYAGELLEHLLPNQAEALMRECFRTLIPRGRLRVNVPDNYEFWKQYCNEHEDMLKKPRNLWNDECSKQIGMFFNDICIKRPILSSMGHYHKWAYDEVTLILQFEKAGFVGVKRRKLHDSEIPDIEAVEKRAYLVVEGTKPLTMDHQ